MHENTAVTEEMTTGSSEVSKAIEAIAAVGEENSASVEEVSASAEEMSAQVEEVSASAQGLAEMAEVLQQVVAQFKIPGADKPAAAQPQPVKPAQWSPSARALEKLPAANLDRSKLFKINGPPAKKLTFLNKKVMIIRMNERILLTLRVRAAAVMAMPRAMMLNHGVFRLGRFRV